MIMTISLFSNELSAQVSLSVNIGTPRYYYLPNIEAYYDIPSSMYLYFFGGRWVHARVLPSSFGYYDFDNSPRIVIRDYRGSRPYNYYKVHRSNFPKGYSGSPDRNYWSAKEYKGQKKNSMNSGKNMNSGNKFRKMDNNYNQGNGNKGNGGGMKGNSKGSGHGKGNKK